MHIRYSGDILAMVKYPPLKWSIPIACHTSSLSSPNSRNLVMKKKTCIFKNFTKFSPYLISDIQTRCPRGLFSGSFPNIGSW